jgi:hypothetical protein
MDTIPRRFLFPDQRVVLVSSFQLVVHRDLARQGHRP